jgi:hypothetical protein
MPKPVAVTYGLCRPELLFYEVPASDDLKFKHNSGKVGRISVDGGMMTAKEIITSELFFSKHFPLYRTVGRLIKNLPVPYGALKEKECV